MNQDSGLYLLAPRQPIFFITEFQSAFRAVAGNFNYMLQFREPVFFPHIKGPILNSGCLKLHGLTATAAQKMMMVRIALTMTVK